MNERAVWQSIWNKLNSTPSRDSVFEALTEAGYDVQDDVVIRPEERAMETA